MSWVDCAPWILSPEIRLEIVGIESIQNVLNPLKTV